MALRCASVGACENAGVTTASMMVASDAHSAAAGLNALIILRDPYRYRWSRRFRRREIFKKGRQKNFRGRHHFRFRVPLQADCCYFL
jgi:hypothetical protein